MITPSFGLTATERVLPRLALDFTTANFDPRITFTRALNTATQINSNGYVESVNADLPRFDYDPVTKICKGLLIEETRSNLLLQSQALSTTPWVTVRGTSTNNTDDTNAPDNAATATKLTQDAGQTTLAAISAGITTSSGVAYTVSIYVKKGQKDFVRFNEFLSRDTAQATYFNINTGAVGTTSTAHTASIVNAANGWYRCIITFTPDATRTSSFNFGHTDTDNSTTVIDSGSTYFWGAQLEAGAFPTSYIPTEATAVTRNADVATMTGTNFSDWFNASEGSFVAQHSQYAAVNGQIYSVSDNSTNNRISFRTSTFAGLVTTGGVAQASVAFAGSGAANTIYKTALGYKANYIQAALGGVLGTADTSAIIPTVDILGLGQVAGAAFLNGVVQKLFYYPQKLTDAELQAFSK